MFVVIAGIVKDGVVVPKVALPEGAQVEIHLIGGPSEVPPELQEEFEAWDRASAEALDLVERLADEDQADARREVNILEFRKNRETVARKLTTCVPFAKHWLHGQGEWH